jgi:serine/arginine repetitive matrix protein 2
MTPRHIERTDDLRSHSTTPRAASASPVNTPVHSSFAASLLRQNSSASSPRRPESPAIKSPTFVRRPSNGVDGSFFDMETADRRRPTSPLAGQSVLGAGISRPTTPSKVIWTAHSRAGSASGQSAHSHAGSVTSSHDGVGLGLPDAAGASLGRQRSLRSPPLPDSPTLELRNPLASLAGASRMIQRPISALSGFELDAGPVRTATPPRALAPAASPPPGGSRRSSLKHGSWTSTPFTLTLGSPHSASFPPIDNSSRSSLASEGSSYHSDQEDVATDRAVDLMRSLGQGRVQWHRFSEEVENGRDDVDNPEIIVRQMGGLTKADFVAIQEKLLETTRAKPEMQRMPSLRRRKPSVSRSIHSLNGEREARVRPRAVPFLLCSRPARRRRHRSVSKLRPHQQRRYLKGS